MLQLFDTVKPEAIRYTADGYMVATVKVARTGIQDYAGWEIDPDNEHGLRDKAIVKVYRPPEEVFADAALKSYAHRPVTNDHPKELVSAKNWKQYSIGQTGGEVDASDGKFVTVPMCVMDGEAIADIKSGKRELSMGYRTALDWTAGVTPEGEAYDVKQTSLMMNHLAVVRRARGGSELKIGDNKSGGRPMDANQHTVTVDGITIPTTQQGAEAITKLKGLLADAATRTQTELAARDAKIEKLSADLAARDAELDKLKGETLSDADLDKRVAARAELVSKAKQIAPNAKFDGLPDAEVRKAAVAAVLGDAAVSDKDAAYIAARFDIMAEDGASAASAEQGLGKHIAGDSKTPVGDAAAEEAAYQASRKALSRD